MGFSITIRKGIALGSGMGGSAASAVAALTAFNAFLIKPLTLHELIPYALLGEELACGQQHADNVIPCLFGGLTLIQSYQPMKVISLPVPDIYCVIVHPHLRVETKAARAALSATLALKTHVQQSANLAAFIAALYQKDVDLLAQATHDVLIEPQRAHLVAGFYHVKDAALQAGALAVSLSGSGPSMFAFAKTETAGKTIALAMQNMFKANNIAADSWVSHISSHGASIKNKQ
jgi:homoserine kinase